VPAITAYLSHSYRPEDREINRHFWDVFWDEGFAFTVDPKSPERLSIPHLELMMQRSACFVAIVPNHGDEGRYRTSPYIVFEHRLAVRARKPRIVVAESDVARDAFGSSPLSVFPRRDPEHAEGLGTLIADLKRQNVGHATDGDQLLGSVGLVLPPGPGRRRASQAIHGVLEAAGYVVQEFSYDQTRAPDFSDVDKHDFFVVDDRAQELVAGLYYRFIPTVRLGHNEEGARPRPQPGAFLSDGIERAGGGGQNVLWWSDEPDLVAQLECQVDRMQRPRRQFRSHDEGARYFSSLGRTGHGRVFISNANDQSRFAGALCRALDLQDIAFFHYQYKNSIAMGTAWEGQVLEHIRSSALFVPLLTAGYWRSELCRRELRFAQHLERQGHVRIYPYFLDDDARMEGVAGANLAAMSLDERVRRIVEDVDHYLTDGAELLERRDRPAVVHLPDEHERTRKALLEDEDTAVIDGHLASCEACRSLAAELQRLDELAPALREPRPGLLDEILDQTRIRRVPSWPNLGETATSS
jgi:hypothetical protein